MIEGDQLDSFSTVKKAQAVASSLPKYPEARVSVLTHSSPLGYGLSERKYPGGESIRRVRTLLVLGNDKFFQSLSQ